jgi:hypothetical protein
MIFSDLVWLLKHTAKTRVFGLGQWNLVWFI